jgi:hypothetical protein
MKNLDHISNGLHIIKNIEDGIVERKQQIETAEKDLQIRKKELAQTLLELAKQYFTPEEFTEAINELGYFQSDYNGSFCDVQVRITQVPDAKRQGTKLDILKLLRTATKKSITDLGSMYNKAVKGAPITLDLLSSRNETILLAKELRKLGCEVYLLRFPLAGCPTVVPGPIEGNWGIYITPGKGIAPPLVEGNWGNEV